MFSNATMAACNSRHSVHSDTLRTVVDKMSYGVTTFSRSLPGGIPRHRSDLVSHVFQLERVPPGLRRQRACPSC